MAAKTNPALRILIPLLAMVAALGIVYAVWVNTGKTVGNSTPANPNSATTANTPPAGTGTTAATPSANPTSPAATPPAPVVVPVGVAAELTNLKIADQSSDPKTTNFSKLGSLDEKSDLPFEVTFNQLGAGIESLKLAKYYKTVERKEHVEVQRSHYVPKVNSAGLVTTDNDAVVPFATLQLELNGARITLVSGTSDRFWKELEPGKFEAFIVNGSNQKVARIEKQYIITPASNSLTVRHALTNLTTLPMVAKFVQMGPSELDPEFTYGLDARRVRYGYLESAKIDPNQTTVKADEFRIERMKALGSRVKTATGANAYTADPVDEKARDAGWPNAISSREEYRLSWLAFTSRYFGVAVHPLLDLTAANPPKALSQIEQVDRIAIDRGDVYESAKVSPIKAVMSLRMTTAQVMVPAGQSAKIEYGVFAGPTSRADLKENPTTRALDLERLVFFKQIGFCAPFSFEFLGDQIYNLIHFLHDHVFFDWSLAIVFMVVIVRTILHPMTKWSQVRMLRFGKQMQGMQPKIKKLQERFKDDKAALQRETARVWSEEGVSPFGMVGCLPMILVMPVWFGVWSVIFHAFELRHQPAFYGIFQSLSSGKWLFLSDLAEPDHIISFSEPISIWGLSSLMGPVSGINVLPLILGVVFFLHQKYLTPPTAGPMTPEQEMQTKMVKYMSIFMFPLMMYNSPSGLALYFIANSTLAIFENQWIRSRAEKQGHLDPENFKKKPGSNGGGGIMAKIMAAAEEKKRLMEQAEQMRKKNQ